MGFPCVVSVPNGSEAFADEWIEDVEGFSQIYLSYDMDEAGRRGIEKAADKLGRYRCLNVLLPLKDSNDCLKAGFTNQEMAEILARQNPSPPRLSSLQRRFSMKSGIFTKVFQVTRECRQDGRILMISWEDSGQ